MASLDPTGAAVRGARVLALAVGLAGRVEGAERVLMTRRVEAVHEAGLVARVLATERLGYAVGPDALEDRPGHVRAASAVGWFGGRLAVVQDDASFVGLYDPATRRTGFVTLPRGSDGLRQFDDGRGNKKRKLDLEAATTVRDGGREVLVAFGSGSAPVREVVVRVEAGPGGGEPAVRVDPAPELYAALRSRREFSGSELNVEGAALLPGGRLRLFQRGNGAPADGLGPVDATVELAWAELVAHLDRVPGAGVPRLGEVVVYDLGTIGGVRLTFTDATAAPGGRVAFLAAAEDSPDAVRDGPVAGGAVGVLEPDGAARVGRLVDREGRTLVRKVEGLALDPARPDRAYVVVDPDDPAVPGELLTVALEGSWWP